MFDHHFHVGAGSLHDPIGISGGMYMSENYGHITPLSVQKSYAFEDIHSLSFSSMLKWSIMLQVKSYLLDLQWQAPMRAVKFDKWMTAKKAGMLQGAEISTNEWTLAADRFRLPKMLGLQVS